MTDNSTYRRLNISQFAREVGYSRRQITRYIETGKLLPRRTLGGLPYFLESDIQKFLNYKPTKSVEVVGPDGVVRIKKQITEPLDLTKE